MVVATRSDAHAVPRSHVCKSHLKSKHMVRADYLSAHDVKMQPPTTQHARRGILRHARSIYKIYKYCLGSASLMPAAIPSACGWVLSQVLVHHPFSPQRRCSTHSLSCHHLKRPGVSLTQVTLSCRRGSVGCPRGCRRRKPPLPGPLQQCDQCRGMSVRIWTLPVCQHCVWQDRDSR